MKYAVVIEKTSTGYSACVPDLPGCVSVGGTRAEIDRNVWEAPIPPPATDTEYVAV